MENKVMESQNLTGATVYILKYTAIQATSILCGTIGVYATKRRAIAVMDDLSNNLVESGYLVSHRSNLERILCNSQKEERRLFVESETIH